MRLKHLSSMVRELAARMARAMEAQMTARLVFDRTADVGMCARTVRQGQRQC